MFVGGACACKPCGSSTTPKAVSKVVAEGRSVASFFLAEPSAVYILRAAVCPGSWKSSVLLRDMSKIGATCRKNLKSLEIE